MVFVQTSTCSSKTTDCEPLTSSKEAQEVFNHTWAQVSAALKDADAVLRGEADKLHDIKSKTAWYSIVYRAASSSREVACLIYNALRKWVMEYLIEDVMADLGSLADSDDVSKLLSRVTERYAYHTQLRLFAVSIFGCLDNIGKGMRWGFPSINELFDRQFFAAVCERVKEQLFDAILGRVNELRNGASVELSALRNTIDVFNHANQNIATHFAWRYISGLTGYYSKIARARFEENVGHYSYVQRAHHWIQTEENLAARLLAPGARMMVVEALEQVLIRPFMNAIILHPDSGIGVLLQDRKADEVKRMYDLFRRVPGPQPRVIMGDELRKYVLSRGRELVMAFNATHDGEDPTPAVSREYVDSLLGLIREMEGRITRLLGGDKVLLNHRNAAFSDIMALPLEANDAVNSSDVVQAGKKANYFTAAEVLANYVDCVLRGLFKDLGGHEMECLEEALLLFSCLREKDVFKECSESHLAARLLHTTPNTDLEKTFVSLLQQQMGKIFTHKMEGMINDIVGTGELAELFRRHSAAAGAEIPATLSFNVQVLSPAVWPAYRSDPLFVPRNLHECLTAFSNFYKQAHTARSLRWVHMLGSATLRIAFPKGAKEVHCNAYQACILLAIDDAGCMKVADLAVNLNVNVQFVKLQLGGMLRACPLLSPITAEEEGNAPKTIQTVADSNVFTFNMVFTHRMRRIQVPAPSLQHRDRSEAEQQLEAHRKAQIDACIVRIMKSHRQLPHRELIDGCVEQLKQLFVPQTKLIKARIEELISRGYLERHEDDPSMFAYLA